MLSRANLYEIMARQRYDPRSAINTNKDRTNINRKDKWETLTGWSVTDPYDDTGIDAWAKRRTLLDSKPVELRKGPIQIWEPYLCKTISKCAEIEDVDLFVKESIDYSLKHVPKSKIKTRNNGTSLPQKDKPLGPGHNVEIYAKVREEHEKKKLDKEKSDEEKKESYKPDTTDKLPEGDTDADKAVKDTAQTEPRPGSATKPETPRSKNKRLLALSQTYNKRAPSDSPLTSARDGEDGADTLKSSSTSSVTEERAAERVVPKLSYTQSNIKLRQLRTLNSGRHSVIRDEDEEDFGPEVTHRKQYSGSSQNSSRSGGRSGMMVTSYPELKERCESRADANLLEAESRSPYSRQSDEEGLGRYRPASVTGTPPSALSSCSGRSDGDSRKTPKQFNLLLNKINLISDMEGEDYLHSRINGRNAVSLPPPSMRHDSPPCSVSRGPTLHPAARKPRSESARSTVGNHLIPIGELLPAVDRSIRTTLGGPRALRLQENMKREQTLEQEFTLKGKDKLLPFEDTIFMMREGVELVRLRERQQSFLGPPAFRPQRVKTPASGRRSDSKRLYGQLSNSYSQGDDGSARGPGTRWQSAAGDMYKTGEDSKINGNTSKSFPSHPKSRGDIPSSGGKFRTPPLTSDPTLNSLYKLSRRRKGSDSSLQGGATSVNFRDVKRLNTRMMDLIRSKTSSHDFRTSGEKMAS